MAFIYVFYEISQRYRLELEQIIDFCKGPNQFINIYTNKKKDVKNILFYKINFRNYFTTKVTFKFTLNSFTSPFSTTTL